MCAKKIVAGARCSSVLLRNRQQDAQQIASAQRFCQLEGLAVACTCISETSWVTETRRLPDGTFIATNISIRNTLPEAWPSEDREYRNLPGWAIGNRYGITVKPPAGTSPAQMREMWQALSGRFSTLAHPLCRLTCTVVSSSLKLERGRCIRVRRVAPMCRRRDRTAVTPPEGLARDRFARRREAATARPRPLRRARSRRRPRRDGHRSPASRLHR